MAAEWPEMREVIQRVVEGKGAGIEGVAGMRVIGGMPNGTTEAKDAATSSSN